MKEEVLNRYFSGKATSAEVDEVLNWIDENEENAKIFASKKTSWVFDNLPETKASDRVYDEFKRRKRPGTNRELFIRVAAIMLIPISILSVIQYIVYFRDEKKEPIEKIEIPAQYESMATYTIHSGVKGMVVLPDSSTVWLNSCSNLKCPSKFDSTGRVVELTGEGYFKVRHNPEWPLYIKTSKGIVVKVTGTEFNLSTYEDDNELKLTLVSGAVTLVRESDNRVFNVKQHEEIIIPDDDRLSDRKISANLPLNTSWKEGTLVFENTPMGEVIKKIERWYGVSVTIDSPAISEFNITANFKSESVSQVFELLQITSNIGYKIKDNQVKLFLK
ncbi:MAG: FecR family protein [Bacteroidales bacterium]|nr:FecR family protein [Bacteroidales bacterium]MDD2424615.1 FecR family protein [Bacteroidales bacterium]MDD3988711.1 FecR family protein [Bacteroidales bacterium]MDD4639125.1 FecR family protein [Bacteroidales bacterium]